MDRKTIIVGIDQSLSNTGITVMIRGEEPRHYSIKPDKQRGVFRLDYITTAIKDILAKLSLEFPGGNIDYVVCREDYAYGGVGDVFNLGELGGCIDLSIYKSANKNCTGDSVRYFKIPPNSWKLLVFGSGSVKKDTQYLLKAFEKTGIKFTDDNIADSHMIAMAISKIISKDKTLTIKQKMGMISSRIRTKNRVTEKNIGKLEEEKYINLIEETLKDYTVFQYN